MKNLEIPEQKKKEINLANSGISSQRSDSGQYKLLN
jgi:hypothetical protein